MRDRLRGNMLGMPGNDLLSHRHSCSTIGAGAFHGRVRDGIGCSHSAIITRQTKHIFSLTAVRPFGPACAGAAQRTGPQSWAQALLGLHWYAGLFAFKRHAGCAPQWR